MGKDQGTPRRSGIDFKAAQRLLDQKKQEKADSGKGGGSDVNWKKLPDEGEMKLRFLPPYGDEPVPGMVVHKHYNLPDHEGIKGNITCFKTWGLDCPICAVIEEYQDRLKLDDFFGASAYFNVLVLDDPKCDPKVPYLLQSNDYNYEWLLQQLVNIEVGDITDVLDGANVTFQRKKKKGAFNRIISRRSSAISDDPAEIDEILDKMYDMKKIWKDPDDNYYNIALDLADQLRTIIEDRLIRSEKDGGDKNRGVKEVQDAKNRRSAAKDKDYDKEQPEVPGQPEPAGRGGRRTAGGEDASAPATRTTRGRATAVADPETPPDEAGAGEPEPSTTRERTRKPRGVAAAADEDKGGQPERGASKKPVSNKPAKAPDCFAIEHSDERRCQICQFEYDCEEATSKAK